MYCVKLFLTHFIDNSCAIVSSRHVCFACFKAYAMFALRSCAVKKTLWSLLKPKGLSNFASTVSVEDPPDVQNLWLNQEGEIFVGVKIGYPAPEYLWQKDGVKLDANSGRFRLLPDGTIKISKVSAEDAGDYKVRISQLNRRRETTETIKVRIFGKRYSLHLKLR